MATYTPEKLRKFLASKSWISPYSKVVAMVDERHQLIELVEEHARGRCIGGAAWAHHHYTKNSPLVISSRREGVRIHYLLRMGSSKVKLSSTTSPAAIESVEVEGGYVKITYSGLAGAGVAAAYSRALASGPVKVEVHEWGGGRKLGRASIWLPLHYKLIVGVDDTDSAEEGATWALMNEIAYKAESEGLAHYIDHAIVQLYPEAPHKTLNCVSVAISFAVMPNAIASLEDFLAEQLQKNTLSQHTAMATYLGIPPPQPLKDYAAKAKRQIVPLDEALRIARLCGVQLREITGRRGIIGALAAIPYAANPEEAVLLD